MATELDDCCPICLQSCQEASYVLPCLHSFCYACILHWIESKPQCPLCRSEVTSILHSVRDNDDFCEHVLPLSLPPSPVGLAERQVPDLPPGLFRPRGPPPGDARRRPRSPWSGLEHFGPPSLGSRHRPLLQRLMTWGRQKLGPIVSSVLDCLDFVQDLFPFIIFIPTVLGFFDLI